MIIGNGKTSHFYRGDEISAGCIGDLYEVTENSFIVLVAKASIEDLHDGEDIRRCIGRATFLVITEPYWRINYGYVVDVLYKGEKYQTFWPFVESAKIVSP